MNQKFIKLIFVVFVIWSATTIVTLNEYRERNVLAVADKRVVTLTQSVSPLPEITIFSMPTTIPASLEPTIAKPFQTENFYLSVINNYRRSKGKTPLSSDSYTCSLATIRAPEIAKLFSHSGFEERKSRNTLGYPGYSRVVENIALSPGSLNVVNMWIASPSHEANLTADIVYGCVIQNGNYYVFEGWTP